MRRPTLKSILGAFRVLRNRASALGQPALTVWVDAGETAASTLGRAVADSAHASEVHDLEADQAIARGLAGLADGRVDPIDLAHFQAASRLVKRSAALDHDIGEAVAQ